MKNIMINVLVSIIILLYTVVIGLLPIGVAAIINYYYYYSGGISPFMIILFGCLEFFWIKLIHIILKEKL